MESDVASAIKRVRARVVTKTLIQDLSEPLTGQLDPRRIAGKVNNLEAAVDNLTDAVDTLNSKFESVA